MLPRIDEGIQTMRQDVFPAVAEGLSDLGEMTMNAMEKAKPVVKASAKKWRHTVDHHIAPSVRSGLVTMGKHTVQGVTAGVDMLAEAVMGEEAKEETFTAMKTLAKAIMGDNVTSDTLQPPDYDYESPSDESIYYLDPPETFLYQQLKPGYYQSIQYPPQPQPINVQDVEQITDFVNYPDLDPRQYHTTFESEDRAEAATSDYSAYYTNFRTPRDYADYHYNTNNYHAEPQTVEEALYVIGKNLLGQNVTDRLFPVAKQMAVGLGQVTEGLETIGDAFPPLPLVEFDASGVRVKTIPHEEKEATPHHQSANDQLVSSASHVTSSVNDERNTDSRITTNAPRCTTAEGGAGRCMDIQNCPLLLADLQKLRESICFKSLFVPGVCCPDTG